MSARAWAEPRGAPAITPSARVLAPLGPQLLTFFAASATAAFAYATLLHRPPATRVLALAALATLYGATVWLIGTRTPPRGLRVALPALATVVALALGFMVLGVPAHLLLPWHWGAFARDLERGLHGLRSWTWPYLGGALWARLAVLVLLVPGLTLMALLYFWPVSRHAGARRIWGLAIAIALALCGMANAPTGAWRAQGVLLVVLVFAWLWVPTLRALDGGRALAWTLACAVPALIAAPLFSSSSAWIPFSSTRVRGPTAFQWDQLYGPIDWSRSDNAMLTVTAANPSLLRVTSLDRFDGLRFIRSSAPPETAASDVATAEHRHAWLQPAVITVAGLRSEQLVGGAGLTMQVRWPQNSSPASLARAGDGTLDLSAPLSAGARYGVVSYVPKPTVAEMQAAPPSLPRAYLPYVQFQLPATRASALAPVNLEYDAGAAPAPALLVRAPGWRSQAATETASAQKILASPYAPMYELARSLAAGAGSNYEVAEHIERFLLANYRYDEHPPQQRYPLEAFLFADRRGYCEQFSGAMTLMLRMDGIPARVGVGFKPVLLDAASSTWTVRAFDAHAWVEVFFAGIGWVSFDPTPAQKGLAKSSSTATTSKAALLARTAGIHRPAPVVRGSGRHRGGSSGGVTGVALAIALAAALALLALTLLAVRPLRRRRGAHTRAGGEQPADLAVRELERALTRLGWTHAPRTTLTQLAARLERVEQREAAAYVELIRDLRYRHDGDIDAARLASARAKRAALRRALAFRRGLRGWLRAFEALPPRLPRPR